MALVTIQQSFLHFGGSSLIITITINYSKLHPTVRSYRYNYFFLVGGGKWMGDHGRIGPLDPQLRMPIIRTCACSCTRVIYVYVYGDKYRPHSFSSRAAEFGFLRAEPSRGIYRGIHLFPAESVFFRGFSSFSRELWRFSFEQLRK